MSKADFEILERAGSLELQHPVFRAPEKDAPSNWKIKQIDSKRQMLLSTGADGGMGEDVGGLARFSVEMFADFLKSLTYSGWSGTVWVDIGVGKKKLFFSDGELCFAASNLIDDRLGEVIYRDALITLDELTNSAVQVTKKNKFGQVLLESEIFSNVQLWRALKRQVREILRSVFMVDHVYIEMKEGKGMAPTEVIFVEETADLINESYGFGCAIRDFKSKLREDSKVLVQIDRARIESEYKPGTFIGDILLLLAEKDKASDLLSSSKLIEINTIATLCYLVSTGLCTVEPSSTTERKHNASLAPLKSKIDAYSYLLTKIYKAFQDAGKEPPIGELREFAISLNPPGFLSLYLDADGGIDRSSITGMSYQGFTNPQRIYYFEKCIEALIRFVLQVTSDTLDWNTAKAIKQEFKSLTI